MVSSNLVVFDCLTLNIKLTLIIFNFIKLTDNLTTKQNVEMTDCLLLNEKWPLKLINYSKLEKKNKCEVNKIKDEAGWNQYKH